ncbi:DUF5304 domain-containing protein [Streptomyces sudanensis]|uniref:DUF5304 domain-containing protein n=1 Tax=Streptomyces sudanensis TaxID=436397 RepID=UPI0020CDB088|nr:DUF5304 domain-containing protein [Streptomyces sudanensis]MCP9959289.1 DUF5304 domain-containing protein [Streptomyces sudanensis]MCP9988364.1 DUF5304 domain-containing protein [Streptomyces sudanensis]MCQ0000254.1 DUF5304 domain-containing protein [Streptomyces sudanensis]
MSDATPSPGPFEDDAWARACAEDLAAERARRRGQGGPPPGSAAEELRKLVDAVADKVSSLGAPLLGAGAQSAVRQVVAQAKSAIEPVVERNPEVFDHLAAAGGELLAAYRSAVEGHERRWTRGPAARAPRDPAAPEDGGEDEGPQGSHRIDLD